MRQILLAAALMAPVAVATSLVSTPASATWYGGSACQPLEDLMKSFGWPPSIPVPQTPEDLIAASGGSVSLSADYGITKVLLFDGHKLVPFTTDREGCKILQGVIEKAGPLKSK